MVSEVYKQRVLSTDRRLNRHVKHDPRSRNFAFAAPRNAKVTSVVHARNCAILDQGNVGSCTGNAGIGCIASTPLFQKLPQSTAPYTLDQPGAQRLYSAAQVIDGSGPYPPNDEGSSGLSIAKALKKAGLISSYSHAFSLNDALVAAATYPFITGINWYSSMFTPDEDGRVKPIGTLAGGHEVLCREIDAERSRIWFDNSWGTSWGVNGRFYMTFADYGALLAQQGDVTILLPRAADPAPAPTPTPAPAPVPAVVADASDVTLNRAINAYLATKPGISNNLMTLIRSINAWKQQKRLA
jgi:hypothetical protein